MICIIIVYEEIMNITTDLDKFYFIGTAYSHTSMRKEILYSLKILVARFPTTHVTCIA